VTFTNDEWDSLCLLLEEGWPGEFGEGARGAWRVMLNDYTVEEVFRAIKGLVARGGKFRPSVAEVVAEIRQDPSSPTFEECYQLIYGRGGVLRARPERATVIRPEDVSRAQKERLEDVHPLVRSFVERQGLGRLERLELNDPVWGELRRKELREAWDAHCEAMEGRDVAALVSGRRGEIGRFDPMAVLGGARREISQTTRERGADERNT
jgi:hypothetical protein